MAEENGAAPSKYDKDRLFQSSLITHASPSLKDELLSAGFIRKYDRNAFIFMDGYAIDHVFILVSGFAKEYYSSATGQDFLRRVIYPGDCFSLQSIFSEHPHYTYSCTSVVQATCFLWPVDKFLKFINRDASLGFQVAKILSSHLEHSCRKNCICQKKESRSRVAAYLLGRCRTGNDMKDCTSSSSVREIDLRPLELSASSICLARETFSRALSSLQEQGLIRSHRGMVELIELEALKVICGAS